MKRVGQPVHALIVEPVYAFDRLVVPVGSQVTGQVTKIEAISGGKRTIAALDADFTPERKVEVSFNDLALPDGRHFQLQTSVSPGSGQVIRFVAATESKERKGVKDAASEKTRQAKEQAKQEWDKAMKQLKTPGRMRRLKRYVEAQLPVHAQYIPVGTVYFAELNAPLDFGTEVMTPQMASSIGGPLPPGSVVHARLITPLTSATSQKGEAVEAVISQPLLDGDHHLILAQGSRLTGTVSQVQPARRMKKNGQLRIRFQELIQPDGIQEKVEATLEGVQSGKDANVKLDSEGGAEATTPKTRYLATALSLTLAAASVSSGDNDVDNGVAHTRGNTGAQVAGGVNGFKLVGMALGLAVKSRGARLHDGRIRRWDVSVLALHRSRTRSRVPEEYSDGDWHRAPARRDCWHGPGDLGSSTGHDLSLAAFNEAGSKIGIVTPGFCNAIVVRPSRRICPVPETSGF